MSKLLGHFKSVFPNKAIVIADDGAEVPEGAIALVFPKEEQCKEVEISTRSIRARRQAIDTKAHDYIALGKAIPPRSRLVKAGSNVPRNFFPVASWDGQRLHLAFPTTMRDPLVRDMLMSSLPGLLRTETETASDHSPLCEGLSIGLSKEKVKVKNEEEQNRKSAESHLRKAEELLAAAERQAIIALNLEVLEKERVDKYAKDQWADILDMIPHSLQWVEVRNGLITCLTTPITLLGNFMGAYQINIDVKTAQLHIYGATPGVNQHNHPHPHVLPGNARDRSGGGICWGTLGKTVTELTARRDYFQLINAALRLLNQYNSDSEYAPLSNWGSNYAGKSEETTDCQRRGPASSLSQLRHCLACNKDAGYCPHKELAGKSLYETCYKMSPSYDCATCKHENCTYFGERFDRCWVIMRQQGTPFCLLKCEQECSNLETAQKACQSSNRRSDGTCPASNQCRKPCIEAEA